MSYDIEFSQLINSMSASDPTVLVDTDEQKEARPRGTPNPRRHEAAKLRSQADIENGVAGYERLLLEARKALQHRPPLPRWKDT